MGCGKSFLDPTKKKCEVSSASTISDKPLQDIPLVKLGKLKMEKEGKLKMEKEGKLKMEKEGKISDAETLKKLFQGEYLKQRTKIKTLRKKKQKS